MTEKTPETLRQETEEAMADLRIGDVFHEMYSFSVEIMDFAHGGEIIARHSSDERVRVCLNAEEFRDHFAYGSIPGYWVTLLERGPEPQDLTKRK